MINLPFILDDLLDEEEIDLIIDILVALERSWQARSVYYEYVEERGGSFTDEQLDRLIDLWAENPSDGENMAFIAEDIEMSDEQQSRLEEAWGVSFDELTVPHKQ